MILLPAWFLKRWCWWSGLLGLVIFVLFSANSNSTPELLKRTADITTSVDNCYAIGPCTPCTVEELESEPSCKATGFKEAVACRKPPQKEEQLLSAATTTLEGEKRYQACQPPSEKFYFFKFATLNVMTGLASAFVIVWRKRKLMAWQTERLGRRLVTA